MDQTTTDQITAAMASFGLIAGIIGIVSIVFAVIVWWRIFSKAGYNGALSLLMFIPIANLVMILILAFAEWPIYAELKQHNCAPTGFALPQLCEAHSVHVD